MNPPTFPYVNYSKYNHLSFYHQHSPLTQLYTTVFLLSPSDTLPPTRPRPLIDSHLCDWLLRGTVILAKTQLITAPLYCYARCDVFG